MSENGTSAASGTKDKQRTEFEDKVRSAFGELVLAVLSLARYEFLGVGDLKTLLLEPLLRNRVSIARANGTAGRMAGFAIWASVSDEVDQRIRDQIKAGIYPLHLRPADWTSGDTVWVLDVVAPDASTATAIASGLQKEHEGKPIKLHPAVVDLLDRPTPKDADAEAGL